MGHAERLKLSAKFPLNPPKADMACNVYGFTPRVGDDCSNKRFERAVSSCYKSSVRALDCAEGIVGPQIDRDLTGEI
jgi:hypothetical protein